MTDVRLIVPVKQLRAAKSRLGDVLDPAGREKLSRDLLAHVLAVAATFPGAEATTVVSRDRDVLEAARGCGAGTVEETAGGGLNAALAEALVHVDPDGRRDILIVPADLPHVGADDLRAMCRPPVALAPDRHGTGTNALFMTAGHRIPFHFGPGSFARHETEARQLGIAPHRVERPGLAFDLDTGEDYARFMAARG